MWTVLAGFFVSLILHQKTISAQFSTTSNFQSPQNQPFSSVVSVLPNFSTPIISGISSSISPGSVESNNAEFAALFAQAQRSQNSGIGGTTFAPVRLDDEYGTNSLGYPNSGYSMQGNDKSAETKAATPEEIENSYKQSLVHLKSQNGMSRHPPFFSSSQPFLGFSQNHFTSPSPSSASNQTSLGLGSVLGIGRNQQALNGIPDIFSTSSPIPVIPSNFDNSGEQVLPQTAFHPTPSSFQTQNLPIFEQTSRIVPFGNVHNVPISVPQLHGLENAARNPIFDAQNFSVNVRYPGDLPLSHHPTSQILPLGGSHNHASREHVKTDFRPSEQDFSKVEFLDPLGKTFSFHAPPMSSGFKPSFGPPTRNGFTRNHVSHSLPDVTTPAVFHEPTEPWRNSFINSHPVGFNNYPTQPLQNFASFPHHNFPSPSPISPTVATAHHPPSAEYKFIFMKGPPALENPDEKTVAYLSYLANSAASHATQLASTTSRLNTPHLYFPLQETSSQQVSEPPPNSFDQLFPLRTQTKRRKKRRKIKPYHRLRRRFKGKRGTSRRTRQKVYSKYLPRNRQANSASNIKQSSAEVFETLKSYGIDPSQFEGNADRGKFTRSTNNSKDRKSKEESEEDSEESEEELPENSNETTQLLKPSTATVPTALPKVSPTVATTSTTTTQVPTTTASTTTESSTTSTTTTTQRPPETASSTTTTNSPVISTPGSLEPPSTTKPTEVEVTTTPRATSTTEKPSTIVSKIVEILSTTAIPIPISNTTKAISNSSFILSVLPKRYDLEATSESRRGQDSKEDNLKNNNSSEDYSSSEELYDDLLNSSSNSEGEIENDESEEITTNGHQRVPQRKDDDGYVIPLFFESAKMGESDNSSEYDDDMMMGTSNKKKDLSSEYTKSSEEQQGTRKKKGKKVRASLAKKLIKEKKRVVKKPRKGKGSKHRSASENLI